MSNFMPWNDSTSTEYREMTPNAKRLADLKSVKPKSGEVEKDMYAKYWDAFEGWTYTNVVITTSGQFQKPDPNCAGAAVDMGHYEVNDLPADGGTAHDRMQTQVEFKRHSSSDPYVDCKTSASGEHVEVDEEVMDDEVEPEEVSDNEAPYTVPI
ncbi:hypothetical protein CPB85DRAFT_1439824 [Mucidula mucida]|nr:hypothetical protein CPB85DRAFT_1439824 [Mucidula mucida]